jgi:hypothetical protein
MNHLENDTTAAIATAISGSSAIIQFTQMWNPVATFALTIVGIISGLYAISYYRNKINKTNKP